MDDASGNDTNDMVRVRTRGDYIYLLDNDTIVLPQAIDAMVAFLRACPLPRKVIDEVGYLDSRMFYATNGPLTFRSW